MQRMKWQRTPNFTANKWISTHVTRFCTPRLVYSFQLEGTIFPRWRQLCRRIFYFECVIHCWWIAANKRLYFFGLLDTNVFVTVGVFLQLDWTVQYTPAADFLDWWWASPFPCFIPLLFISWKCWAVFLSKLLVNSSAIYRIYFIASLFFWRRWKKNTLKWCHSSKSKILKYLLFACELCRPVHRIADIQHGWRRLLQSRWRNCIGTIDGIFPAHVVIERKKQIAQNILFYSPIWVHFTYNLINLKSHTSSTFVAIASFICKWVGITHSTETSVCWTSTTARHGREQLSADSVPVPRARAGLEVFRIDSNSKGSSFTKRVKVKKALAPLNVLVHIFVLHELVLLTLYNFHC